ncbi:hypothetical protein B5X24_HaOG215757 [Helicoverpa armigera]|uniref:Protein kinase domain-containing protein n=2 Tax=Helicoverpa armigera TaxID=29058 RepID=A0A2W1AZQ8_HELAM|nr:hypothetical protein B5X24_HaOG215757 [Helicoverpa armigera]
MPLMYCYNINNVKLCICLHIYKTFQAFRRLELGAAEPRRLRLSEESRTSDGDSGVGAESNASSRLGSVEGIVNPDGQTYSIATAWTVEQCILAGCSNTRLQCPTHAQLLQRGAVAPDTLLLDVEESKRARWEHISRGAVAGRGAFGTVLAATWRPPGGSAINVALKALQPELSILSQLKHQHVVPLLAVCAAPLALLLALAPAEHNTQNDGEWIEVKKRNHRQRQKPLHGTADPLAIKLKAMEIRKYFHLWNMASDVDEVRQYLSQLYPAANCSVEELSARGDYKSYKIGRVASPLRQTISKTRLLAGPFVINHVQSNNDKTNKLNRIYAYYQNVRGLKTKLSTWRNNLSLLEHNLVAVTETFLDSSVMDSELVSGDWSILRRDRDTPCGGVLLAARTPLALRRRREYETDSGEDLWASFTWQGLAFLVCVVYIKPSASDEDYMSWFCKTESFIHDFKGSVIIMGDLNLNIASMNITNYYSYFLSYCSLIDTNNILNVHGGKLDVILVREGFHEVSVSKSDSIVPPDAYHPPLEAEVEKHLSNAQHGFRRKRSVETNLLTLTEYISAQLDKRKQVDVLYFDFRKAFDRVNNDILLTKLHAIGFCPNLLRLLADYLRDRQQYVRLGIYESGTYHTRSGVSQGSILGPLLFLLMVNDLPEVSQFAKCLLYADDLKLYACVDTVSDCEAIQRDIDLVYDWSVHNKMEFNSSKCFVMTFGRKQHPITFEYKINGSIVTRSSTMKDLGVVFDQKLTFHDHITTVAKESFKRLGFVLRNSRDFQHKHVIKLLYSTLVRSKLEASSCVWNPHEASYALLLEKVQKKFLRFLYKFSLGYYPYLYPTKYLIGCLGYNMLGTRRAYDQLIIMLKINRGITDAPDLHNELIRLYAPNNYLRARKHRLLAVPVCRTVARASSPIPRVLSALNSLMETFPDCDLFTDEPYIVKKGALDSVLRSYRECGARLRVTVARALALQVARALEYLHARRVVYRDLKSENVLVWKMPKPGEDLTSGPLNVHVKLGDYGISRLAPPSGTKGFGGTEGFMAPEIMRYNGEEEYNEKVDCFSYGMLLYEIVTVRQPFEGHEAVKEAVLDGARPSLSPRDLEYPCSILETMQEGIPGWELWYGGGEPERAHTLLTTATNFTHHHTIRVPPDKAEPVMVTAMCRVGNKMWLGDSAGRISVYSASSCALVWCVRVQEAVGGAPSGIAALHALPGLQRVAVALSIGRLFLVTSKRPEAEGSFVLTELGTATELCCLAAVPSPHGWEVWAGGAGLCSYAVGAGGVCAADVLAPEPRVTLMAAPEDQPFVMVYYDPGVCVYQWSVGCKQQCARLDCSKLVPCSESLQSIALDEHLTEDKCRVTALCALRGELYIGTAWGCVIVADATSLRPLTVFRPYEEDVRVIIPLHPHKAEEAPMIATFGHGYRPLLQRYAPHSSSSTNTHNGYYCLLWQTQHWLPD